MECDPATLLAAARCFLCLTAQQMDAIQAALLCDIFGGTENFRVTENLIARITMDGEIRIIE